MGPTKIIMKEMKIFILDHDIQIHYKNKHLGLKQLCNIHSITFKLHKATEVSHMVAYSFLFKGPRTHQQNV
jgi:hypothetical protein